jgi:hypothetical protein
MMYDTEMASCGMIYIPSFMKTGTCIEAILRFCLSNFKGCNVGITDFMDLCSMLLTYAKWNDIHTKFH